MLTYQLQTRVFVLENDEPLTFPNLAEVTIKLGPGTAFGTADEPSRTLAQLPQRLT